MAWIDDVVRRLLIALPIPGRDRLYFAWRYRRGLAPWDSGQTPPEVAAWAEQAAPGRMLDLGCGTGTNVLFFAARGWAATGVDFVGEAIAEAEHKRDLQALEATFFQGDVTHLEALPLAPPYNLLLDIGCLHTLPDEAARERYAAQAAQLTQPGATYLLYAAIPGSQQRPRGIEPPRVAELFAPHFTVQSEELGADTGGAWRSAWYRLARV